MSLEFAPSAAIDRLVPPRLPSSKVLQVPAYASRSSPPGHRLPVAQIRKGIKIVGPAAALPRNTPALPSGIFSRPCLCRVVRLARCAFALRPSGGVSNYVLTLTHYCLCTQNIGSILRYYKPALWLHECRGGLSTIRAPMPPRAACPRTRPQIPWRAPHDHLVAT